MNTKIKENILQFLKYSLENSSPEIETKEKTLYYGLTANPEYENIIQDKDIVAFLIKSIVKKDRRHTVRFDKNHLNLIIDDLDINFLFNILISEENTLLLQSLKKNNEYNEHIINKLATDNLNSKNKNKLLKILKDNTTDILHQSFAAKHYKFCDLLLEQGFSLNDTDSEGNNLFFYIKSADQFDYIYNNKNSIDLNQKNNEGKVASEQVVGIITHSNIGDKYFSPRHKNFLKQLISYHKWHEDLLPYVIQYEFHTSKKEDFSDFMKSLKSKTKVNIKSLINKDLNGLSIIDDNLSFLIYKSNQSIIDYSAKIETLMDIGFDVTRINQKNDISLASSILLNIQSQQERAYIIEKMKNKNVFENRDFIEKVIKDIYTKELLSVAENSEKFNFEYLKSNSLYKIQKQVIHTDPMVHNPSIKSTKDIKYYLDKENKHTQPEKTKNKHFQITEKKSNTPQKPISALEETINIYSQLNEILNYPNFSSFLFYTHRLYSFLGTEENENLKIYLSDDSFGKIFKNTMNAKGKDKEKSLKFCCLFALDLLTIRINSKNQFELITQKIENDSFSLEAKTLSGQVEELENKLLFQPDTETNKAVKILEYLTIFNLEKLVKDPDFSQLFIDKAEQMKDYFINKQDKNMETHNILFNTIEKYTLENEISTHQKTKRKTPKL